MSAPDDAPKAAPKIPLAHGAVTHVAQIRRGPEYRFPWTDLSCARRDRCSKGGEAVQDRGPDLKLGDLSVEAARHAALAQELEAAHLGFGQTSLVIACPALPYGPAKAAATA